MKSQYEKVYKKLYCLPQESFWRCGEKVQNSFVFCGSGNWEMYCTQKGQSKKFLQYEDVELIGFDNTKAINAYSIDNNKIIDFSREHITEDNVEKYFLLVQR